MAPGDLNAIFAVRKTYLGLSSQEATDKLAVFGYNARPANGQKKWWKNLVEIATEPMILLLLAASAIYFFIGDKLETIILLFSIIPVILIELFQEQRTNEAIKALDKMMAQYASVCRDGKIVKLEIKYLVPGDLVYLTAGDKIPADGISLKSPGLMLDESMLTGESIAVTKTEAPNSPDSITDENRLWQGTMVTQGDGYMLVTLTGIQTAYGQLGTLLKQITEQGTPLQKKIRQLVRSIAIIALASAIVVGILMTLKENWMVGILSGITIAMSLIPEEFPIVFSVFLVMGVWRMTKQNALIRKMAMVEILGSATVICTDKTGTLTEGNMALKMIYHHDHFHHIEESKNHHKEFVDLIKSALLALEQVAIDPIEIEIQNFAKQIGIDIPELYREHILVEDSPFEAKTKLVHHIWKNTAGQHVQFSAGAPESIIRNSSLTNAEKESVTQACEAMSEKGYRVIAIGKREIGENKKVVLEKIEFLGLLAMSDPPRAGVKDAIDSCQKAGVRIIMITGDNKLTAHNIAEQIGLKHNEELINGHELDGLSPAALIEIVRRHDIFARVKPEQKYLIVDALQKNGDIVAMTGDGVNDAPALKKADIGIAMGIRGTEVARAAAGMVLTDDNFASIVNAIKEGRRIYDNLRQAFAFLLVFHIPIVSLALLPLFFGGTLIFSPIHIIFLELFCDPASVLGFDRERARRGLMNEPPRPTTEPLINPNIFWRVIIQGLSITAITFGFYAYYALYLNQPDIGRTLAFATLVIAQVTLIICSREWQQIKTNRLLLIIALITFGAMITILELPILRQIFHLVQLNINQWSEILLVTPIAVIIIAQIAKQIQKNKTL
jgi:Ca2+-transporting ATPase